MSKNACCRSRPQKLWAATSRRAPSSLLAVLSLNRSVVTCCRVGSIQTLLQTSLRYSAVMSLSSLCLIDGNPPHGQIIAWSMPKDLPQTHEDGRLGGRQPYRRQIASRKAPLCKAKPCSAIGRAESQLEAPFSLLTSMTLCRLFGSFFIRLSAAALFSLRLLFWASFLLCCCWDLVSGGHVDDCCRIRAVSGFVIFKEHSCWKAVCFDGSVIPSPPWQTGSATSSLSESLSATWPVIAGRNFCRMVFSSGLSRSPMSGIVLARYVHLLIAPWVKAA